VLDCWCHRATGTNTHQDQPPAEIGTQRRSGGLVDGCDDLLGQPHTPSIPPSRRRRKRPILPGLLTCQRTGQCGGGCPHFGRARSVLFLGYLPGSHDSFLRYRLSHLTQPRAPFGLTASGSVFSSRKPCPPPLRRWRDLRSEYESWNVSLAVRHHLRT
jgi:hypothetical protein